MLERVLMTILIMGAMFAAFQIYDHWQKQRISGRLISAVSEPTLIYFHGDSCAACPTQTRFVDQVGQRFTVGLQIRKIDAEREPETAAAYGVMSLPTTVLVDPKGAVQHINYGLTPVQKLVQQVEKLL